MKMTWKDEFATGIHNIDDQHETILESITRFVRKSDAGARSEALGPLLLAPLVRQLLFGHVAESDKRFAQYALDLFSGPSFGAAQDADQEPIS
jgi:hemerythrin